MAANSTPNAWITLVSIVIAGGGFKYSLDIYKSWKNGPPHELRKQGLVDASIATVARARDELEEDNVRLRQTLAEERKQHTEERVRYLADITRLEQQIRAERAEAKQRAMEQDQRYNVLLEQINNLRRPNSERETM
jgi:hypothetical protein